MKSVQWWVAKKIKGERVPELWEEYTSKRAAEKALRESYGPDQHGKVFCLMKMTLETVTEK